MRTVNYIRTLTLVIAILALSSVSLSQSRADTEKSLMSVVKRMVDAQIAYDPAALDRIFTADYIEISPVGEFDPRAKVLGFYKPEAKLDPAKFVPTVEPTDYSIRIYDDFAVVITRLNFAMTGEGKPLPPRSLRATFVFRKENGSWKIASAQYTGIRTPKT